ncbi:MAG: hypothetical protein WBG36_03930 [Ornithinimicrobium sp.]
MNDQSAKLQPHDPASQRRQLANLGPIEQLRAGKLPRRLIQLVVGLFLYGASMALVIRAGLGVIPWDVLHLGIITHVPTTFGTMTILVSLVVLLLWIPLRQRPGVGTIANAFLVGLSADLVLNLVPDLSSLQARIPLLIGAIALNGLATALYVGAQLGPGPRDGLMTGLARVSGRSIRLVRTAIEVTVVLIGVILAGSVSGVLGLGTILYAVSIGPLTQAMLPWCTVPLNPRRAPTITHDSPTP